MAHELRDPLNTILLALELYSCAGGSAGRKAVTMATHQAWRAVRIIDDLFALCAGSLGSLPLHKEVVDLATVVAWATQANGAPSGRPGHRLKVELQPNP